MLLYVIKAIYIYTSNPYRVGYIPLQELGEEERSTRENKKKKCVGGKIKPTKKEKKEKGKER